MSRVLAISGLILAIAIIGIDASALPAEKTINATVVVVTKDQMDKLLQDYPNAVPLTRKFVEPEERADFTVIYIYTLANRVLGDELVAHGEGYHTWIDPREVVMTMEYPSVPGTGAIVTHVHIKIVQASTSGRAYAIAGGIGYRYITVVVEAEDTNRFDYFNDVYGIR